MSTLSGLLGLPERLPDLKRQYHRWRKEFDRAYERVMQSGRYIGGGEVQAFEEAWAEYCGVEHCVALGNGLDALRLALQACDTGPGNRVVVPSNTYIASWLAISHLGADPYPHEPDPKTMVWEQDGFHHVPLSTNAVMPVHLYGLPCDMEPILDFCERADLFVISDCAQAHGAMYKGRNIAQFGDACCWSFYPTKNLGAFGDAGAVTTNHEGLAEIVRELRDYGRSEHGRHVRQGWNSRMDPLQAAFLTVKLAHLDEMNINRNAIAGRYFTAFRGLHGLQLPHNPPDRASVWHQFVVRTERRDELREKLLGRGVWTKVHYPVPPHLSPAYQVEMVDFSLPLAEQLAEQCLSLPMDPFMTQDELDLVTETVLGFYA